MNLSTHNRFSLFSVAVLAFVALLFVSLQTSFASQKLVEKYQELAESSGFTFTYGSLESHAADNFTLHDITLIRHGVEDPLKIKSMTLTGVKELTGIGLSADSFAIKGVSWDGRNQKGREVTILLREARVNGFYMPDPDDLDAPLFAFDNYSASASDFSVLVEGETVVEMPSVTTQFNGDMVSKKFAATLNLSHITLYPENIDNGDGLHRRLQSLGYEDLKMDINLDMDWDAQSGRLAISKYEFDLMDMGAFDIQLVVGGYTEILMKKIREISARIKALPAQERDSASQEVLAQMSALTVESMKLSFRDNSITDKIIGIQARAQGQSPDDMKAILPAMLNGALAGMQQPQLATKLVSAVEAFLADPGTISVSAKPEIPLSFAEITGLGMALPGILIEKLNITAQAK